MAYAAGQDQVKEEDRTSDGEAPPNDGPPKKKIKTDEAEQQQKAPPVEPSTTPAPNLRLGSQPKPNPASSVSRPSTARPPSRPASVQPIAGRVMESRRPLAWGDPRLPHEWLRKQAEKDPQHLLPIFMEHELLFRILNEHQGRSKGFLYSQSRPCEMELDGIEHDTTPSRCSKMHGVEYLMFVWSTAIIKHGYQNHTCFRPQPGPFRNNDMDPVRSICWPWAVYLYPDIKKHPRTLCLHERGVPYHPRNQANQTDTMYSFHSFDSIELWTLKLYRRLPDRDRTPLHRRMLRLMGIYST